MNEDGGVILSGLSGGRCQVCGVQNGNMCLIHVADDIFVIVCAEDNNEDRTDVYMGRDTFPDLMFDLQFEAPDEAEGVMDLTDDDLDDDA
jgi:hypothetical protein